MGKIVVIGGGSIDSMVPLLQQAINLCRKASPRTTVIPTAAGSPEAEKSVFDLWQGVFSQVTANVRPLFLLKHSPTQDELRSVLNSTDMVWVPGGGDVRLMLQTWRRVGLDRELRRAFRRGVVMSGRSAGANCWFKYSLGGETLKSHARFFSYRRNRGLGLINSTLCCHYQDRREPFRHLLDTFGGTGVGLPDGVGLVIDDDSFSVVSNGDRKAYAVCISEETNFLAERVLEVTMNWRPLTQLGIEPGKKGGKT